TARLSSSSIGGRDSGMGLTAGLSLAGLIGSSPAWSSELHRSAEPRRSRGRLNHGEGSHSVGGGNAVRPSAGARVEERLKLEPERLVSLRRKFLLSCFHRLPRLVPPEMLAQMERDDRRAVVP